MKNQSSKLCPKCGKSFLRIYPWNSNYDIYVHEQTDDANGPKGLIKYCIVSVNFNYTWSVINDVINRLKPEKRTSTPPE